MNALGICVGLTCGLLHAVTYLFSRRFMKVPGQTAGQLACIAHIYMGAVSLACLPFLWFAPTAGWRAVAWPLTGCTLFYMCGQLCMFHTIRKIEASRIAPMLGAKIAVIAVIMTLTGLKTVTPLQWVAVVLAVLSIRLINVAPQRDDAPPVPWTIYLWVGAICMGYALSDLHIRLLLDALSETRSPMVSVFAVCLTYTMAGAGSLFFLWYFRKSTAQAWRMALPFCVGWYLSMITLFTTIGLVDVVAAVILQSTRGIWAIVLGMIIAHLGHTHLESRLSLKHRLIQISAASLMCVAIALHELGKA